MQVFESSKALLTMNTHKELFKFARLPFGVSSTPALFQAALDNIAMCACYIDDVIDYSQREI